MLNGSDLNSKSLNTGTFAFVLVKLILLMMKLVIMRMKILQILKKVVLPLIIIKIVIFVFLVIKSDLISISRDINYGNNLPGLVNDSTDLQKQKSFRIVRNTEDRGISIILREKKNARYFREKNEEISNPIVD